MPKSAHEYTRITFWYTMVCKTGQIALQNGPFHTAIRPISQSNMAHFAKPFSLTKKTRIIASRDC